MVYTKVVVFYGWNNQDVLDVIKILTNDELIEFKHDDIVTEEFHTCFNSMLNIQKLNLTFDFLNRNLGSSDDLLKSYLYFGKHIELYNDKQNDFDINFNESNYDIDKLQELMELFDNFKKIYPNVPRPTLKVIMISDPNVI